MNEVSVFDNSVDFAVGAWLHEKASRTGSSNTERIYGRILRAYRAELGRINLDLDGDTRRLALVLQAYCARTPGNLASGDVSPATYNLRLATVSSFYRYCRRHQLLNSPDNPAERVERRPAQSYRNAQPLDAETVRLGLLAIPRDSLADKRDYALLLLALTTGRRLSEIAHLKITDFTQQGSHVLVTFTHAKGGKVMRDRLSKPVAKAIEDYLSATSLNTEWLWYSLSRNGTYGNPLSIQALEQICLRWLGTSRFHTLRHTFAHAMESSGAKVSDIQARLGHSSIATTGVYLAALHADENAHADELTRLFIGE